MNIQETVRRDGLRIISCNIPTQTRVLVSISALVGYCSDPADREGLFHYFEHMAFKGTSHRDLKQIREFASRHFLGSNAVTHATSTEYWAIVVHNKLHLVCDFLTDLYAHSTFPESEIKKEKGPVLLEAARSKDNDPQVANLALRRLLFRSNPLRQFAVGSKEGIEHITRKDLLREKAKWYVPSNTVAVAVGRVSHRAFVREIEKRIPLNKVSVVRPSWDPEFSGLPSEDRKVIRLGDRNRSTVMMGCKMPLKVSDRVEAVEDFMVALLVSGWSSRLYTEVRESRGLAYSAGGSIGRVDDVGSYFAASVQTMPGKEAIVEKLMRQALFTPITSKDKKILEATLEKANDAITAGFGENLSAWCGLIYSKISRGEPLSGIKHHFEEQRRILNKVNIREAEKIRKDLFRPERFATVIIKPKS